MMPSEATAIRAPVRVRAFRHPLWWGALGVLVLNDHVLKRALLVPAWLTGKASDVAGLLVAVPLVVACVAARSAWARRAVAVGVAALFVALELSPAFVAEVERVSRALGIPWRLWTDPTDLLALVFLPLASWLAVFVDAGPVRVGRDRLAIAFAAVACLASGSGGSGTKPPSGPTVKNDTEMGAMLVVASTDGAGGCDVYTQDRVSILTPDAYGERREVVLEPSERAALGEGTCGAAWLQLAEDDDLYVYWRELPPLDSSVPQGDQRRTARTVSLEGRPGRYTAKLGEDLHRFDPGRDPPGSNCPEPHVEHSLRWTDLPSPQSWLELRQVARDADGCLEVTWAGDEDDDAGGALVQTLCIPDWAFPFSEGEVASVIQEGTSERGVLRITHYEKAEVVVQVSIWANAEDLEDPPFEGVEVVDCFGALTACGAYVRPVRVRVDGDEELLPGDETRVDDKEAETRILVGPSVEVGWAAPACVGHEAVVGNNVNALALRKF
jgi:hypothetical protein